MLLQDHFDSLSFPWVLTLLILLYTWLKIRAMKSVELYGSFMTSMASSTPEENSSVDSKVA